MDDSLVHASPPQMHRAGTPLNQPIRQRIPMPLSRLWRRSRDRRHDGTGRPLHLRSSRNSKSLQVATSLTCMTCVRLAINGLWSAFSCRPPRIGRDRFMQLIDAAIDRQSLRIRACDNKTAARYVDGALALESRGSCVFVTYGDEACETPHSLTGPAAPQALSSMHNSNFKGLSAATRGAPTHQASILWHLALHLLP